MWDIERRDMRSVRDNSCTGLPLNKKYWQDFRIESEALDL